MILEILLTLIFLFAFLLIILEDSLKMNKAKSTLFFGTLVWIILFIFPNNFGGVEVISEKFQENILEIAMLWLFLISAMTFVAYLDKREFIKNTIQKYLPEEISEKKLLLIIGLFTFFLSAIIDDMTSALVSLTILLSLDIDRKKLVKFAVLVVFCANAGGVSLITGDVTTLMIFLAGKVEIYKLLWLFIPAFISMLILYFLLSRSLKGKIQIKKEIKKFRRIDILIVGIFLSTILMIILGHIYFHIPPVLTFMFGLSVMFLTGWAYNQKKKEDLQLLHYIREVEFDALFFFLGILLLIGMLQEIGVLSIFVKIYDLIPASYSSYFIGIFSSLVDNIALTAAILKSGLVISESQWFALTYAVGVGGSILAIGSAAGIVSMCKIDEVTFVSYFKNSLFVLIAYSVGYISSIILGNLIF